MPFKIGDSIKVKPGICDPDSNADLSGYQGRIIEVCESDLYGIQWDSQTLKKLPHEYIKEAEQQGLGWDSFYLYEADFVSATPRDTENEVEQVYYQLQREFFWVHLGEQGDRISAVLSGVAPYSEAAAFNAWKKYLTHTLTFPFQAEIAEYQEAGPLQCDEVVTVDRIVETESIDPDHGLFVEIRKQKRHYLFRLSELEVVDKQSNNFTPVKDYVVWFANR